MLRCLEIDIKAESINMFEFARRGPHTPSEKTLGASAEFVDQGKIGGVVLSDIVQRRSEMP